MQERTGTEHQFFQRENAHFDKDVSAAGPKNATTEEFFKADEAMRGDITSQDRSVAATQQDYVANIDKQELGRPDSYERLKSDVPQDYMNKSDMGKSAIGQPRGVATPRNDKEATQIDYMNKSTNKCSKNRPI